MVHKRRYEDYLTTIYRLEEALGEAKTGDIARELKVSPATVSKVLRQLESKGLVERVKYHHVRLVGRGREIAELVVRKHRIAEVFLADVLGFNELDSHSYAHYLEHLPDIIIERLYAYTNYPQHCPHGNRIPSSSSGEAKEAGLSALSNVLEGETCTVAKIGGEFTEILEFLYKEGIKIGVALTVAKRGPQGVLVKLNDNRIREIPYYVARFVHLKC